MTLTKEQRLAFEVDTLNARAMKMSWENNTTRLTPFEQVFPKDALTLAVAAHLEAAEAVATAARAWAETSTAYAALFWGNSRLSTGARIRLAAKADAAEEALRAALANIAEGEGC